MTEIVDFVLAHPDDEHGGSGTILKLKEAGKKVRILVTTEGLTNGPERRLEMMASAKILGVDSVHFMGEPDGSLEYTKGTIKKYNDLVDSMGPPADAVFVMHPVDSHPDHVVTSALTTRRHFQRGVNTPLFAYALNSSGRAYNFIRPQTTAFFPTHYSDVGRFIETMKAADACHVTQDPDGMWKGVEAMLRGRSEQASTYGGQIVHYAEAFVYMTRFEHDRAPEWIDKFFIKPFWTPPSIPYPVTAEAVGLVSPG